MNTTEQTPNISNWEVRNISIVKRLSRETLCFTADVFEKSADAKRGKKLFSVYNEGNGGMTRIEHGSNFKAWNMESQISDWVDAQVSEFADNKEQVKFNRKMERAAQKLLVFYKGDPVTEFIKVGSVGLTLADYSQNFIVNTLKKYMEAGWVLFNKNIDPQLVEKAEESLTTPVQ